jgi:uncharacterized protein (DUF433 family)
MQLMVTNYGRITVDPEQMNGQPCIRGMRITVRRVLESLTVYPDWAELLQEYPELETEDIRRALAFAADTIDDSVIVTDLAA